MGLCGLMGWGKWSLEFGVWNLERGLSHGLCDEVFDEVVDFFYRRDAEVAERFVLFF